MATKCHEHPSTKNQTSPSRKNQTSKRRNPHLQASIWGPGWRVEAELRGPRFQPYTRTPKRPQKYKDATNHDFWYPSYVWPWNQNLRSFILTVSFGPCRHPASRVSYEDDGISESPRHTQRRQNAEGYLLEGAIWLFL